MSLLWFLSPREEEGKPQEKPRKTGECLLGPRAVGARVAPLQPLGALAQPTANQQLPWAGAHASGAPASRSRRHCPA